MIREKYVNAGEDKVTFQYGLTNVNELLQHNVGKNYPELVVLMDPNTNFKFVQFPFFAPADAVGKIYKIGEIKTTLYTKLFTVKEGSLKYKLVLDFFGV